MDSNWSSRPTRTVAHPRLLRIEEAADRLGVSRATAWKLVASGTLPIVTVGVRSRRIREADLRRYIEELQ